MKLLRIISFVFACATAFVLACCVSGLTPTREISSGYAIFDIQATSEVRPGQIAEAVKLALQKNMSRVQIVNSIPPSPLPERAPRFQLVSPLRGSNLGALAAASGQSIQIPICECAIITGMPSGCSINSFNSCNRRI